MSRKESLKDTRSVHKGCKRKMATMSWFSCFRAISHIKNGKTSQQENVRGTQGGAQYAPVGCSRGPTWAGQYLKKRESG